MGHFLVIFVVKKWIYLIDIYTLDIIKWSLGIEYYGVPPLFQGHNMLHQEWSTDGPRYHVSVPLEAQDPHTVGTS